MSNKIKQYLAKKKIERINRKNKENENGEVILPLYFGWQIKIILERVKNLQKHIVGPFKQYWQYMTMVVVLIAVVSIGLLLQSDYRAKGATYGWFQNTWSGGADTEAVADHTHNQTGWLKFFSKDSQINTADDEIKLNLTTGSHTETDDASGFAAGTHNNTYSTGTGIAMKKNNGVSCGGNIQCTSGNCDADFSSGSYCHATASSCVYYTGGGPWELDNGWEQCSGNDYYKSCANSVWGSAVYPINDYCDAGGGTQTGYLTSFICNSDMNGGFSSSCQSCFPYKANIDSCKSSCASDADCWNTHFCSNGTCFSWENWITNGPCAGIAVYKQDLSSVYQWKTSRTACSTPQCEQDGGQDGDILVVDNNVDFSLYPARNACKIIGGRLPTREELLCVYNNKVSYGNNFKSSDWYWSSVEASSAEAYNFYMGGGFSTLIYKDNTYYIRCVITD